MAKRTLDQDYLEIAEEINKQSILPDIGTGVGVVSTLGEGLLARPANALIRGSDEIASKIGLKTATSVADSAAEAKIASSMLKEGAGISSKLSKSASSIAKGAAVGVKDGIIHGVALSAPVAAVDLIFKDPRAAAEAMLIGGGVGGAFEGIISVITSKPSYTLICTKLSMSFNTRCD